MVSCYISFSLTHCVNLFSVLLGDGQSGAVAKATQKKKLITLRGPRQSPCMSKVGFTLKEAPRKEAQLDRWEVERARDHG